ncbi:hypothetical protein [Vibrio coralliilyticus]|uniref:hypothetical protein n=1 Tax=Vibrio coralliilyticus TaxID=190893 RepID=UPI000BAAA7E2|nr:hypothetical protein [Vibrio coralliilyticus]NOI58929.1 hypothetical protein [Vibrio coralliilyticus]PAT66707.1 hypothetical protein CKA27_17795 [Vibrio coralliilyticus]
MSYKKELNHLLDHSSFSVDLSNTPFTLLFVYPGIGVGKVFEDLAGCTQQLCQLATTQERAQTLGVQIAALSSVDETVESLHSAYFPIGSVSAELIPKDLLVTKGEQHFFARAAYLVHPDGQVERWIDPDGARMVEDGFRKVEHAYRQFVHTVTNDSMNEEDLSQCRLVALPTGADSLGVLSFDMTHPYVLKRMPAEGTDIETDYMFQSKKNDNSIFPVMYAQSVFGSERWVVMEKLGELPEHNTHQLIARLAHFYHSTRTDAPIDLDYHLYQRFFQILASEGFAHTLTSLSMTEGRALEQTVWVGKRQTSTMKSLLDDLNDALPTFQSPFTCCIHGDVHWPNVLGSQEGAIKLIDPRLHWDGCFLIDGHFDPTYDLATLLHSSVLEKLDHTEMSANRDGTIAASAYLVDVIEKLESDLLQSAHALLPALIDDSTFVRKLRVFCANATFGWLKYHQVVTSQEKWRFYFGLTLYWLDRAFKK